MAAFLAGHIRFGGIHRCIARVMDKVTPPDALGAGGGPGL